MKKSETLTITNETQLEGNYFDEIELREEGCLKFVVDQDNPNFKQITINRLINNKYQNYEPKLRKYDIYVTSKDGENAASGTGLNGGDAKNGGDFTIIVNDLVDDVKVYIKGGRGGNGGSGKLVNPKLGGKGGNGGNGGNGANVTFYYGHQNGTNGLPFLYLNNIKDSGGNGGNGGNGAICSDPIGKGGTPTTDFSTGGKNGDGGKSGENGYKGSWNTIELTQSRKPLNLNNEKEYNKFLKIFGGEDTLKKYPKIWNSIQVTRNKDTLQEDSDSGLVFDTEGSSAEILTPMTNLKSIKEENQSIRFRINNVMNVYNKQQFNQDNKNNSAPPPPLPKYCSRYMEIIEDINGVEHIIKTLNSRIFDEDCHQISEVLDTEPILAQSVSNRYLKIRTYYIFDNTKIITFDTTIKNGSGDALESFYKKTILHNPRYKSDGKTNGNIKILYGRTPELQEYADADYYGDKTPYGNFESNRVPPQGNVFHIPTTILPISGTIHFQNRSGFKITGFEVVNYVTEEKLPDGTTRKKTREKPHLSYSTDIGHILVEMGAGTTENKAPQKDLAQRLKDADSFKQNIDPENDYNTTLDFDLHLRKDGYTPYGKCDWESEIEEAFYSDTTIHKNLCCLLGSINFNIEFQPVNNPSQKLTTNLSVSFQSVDGLKYDEYFETPDYITTVNIPKLIICWGCYAADTLIKTTEGNKRANEIKRGDKIPVYGEKTLTVSQIYIGDDKWIYNIKTIDNRSIRVSGSHAMKLYCESNPDGKKISAGRIKKGDILMTPNGNIEVYSVETEAYNDKVYNFEFEEEKTPNYIEANGFWSGDFVAQNESEKYVLTPEEKEICAEWQQLTAERTKAIQQ